MMHAPPAPGLAVLRAAANGRNLPDLSVEAWEQVLTELAAHDVAPFLYCHVRSTAQWAALSGAVQNAWRQAFQTHSVRSYLMENELRQIVAALRAAGVPVILLKGAALGRLVYGSPAERPVNDLDLLVPAEAIDAARDALIERDYLPQGLFWLGHWQRRYRAELPMVCQAADRRRLLVELHWSLLELPYYIERIPMADIWSLAQVAPGIPDAFVPDSTTLLLHSCAHQMMHHNQERRLLWLLDVDRLVRLGDLDWDAVLDRAPRWGLVLTLKMMLDEAMRLLETPVPPAVQAALARCATEPVERAMWGVGDNRPGRAWRRVQATVAAFDSRQRLAYLGWLALRGASWLPESIQRTAHRAADAQRAAADHTGHHLPGQAGP
jgi:hypothetical protein